MCGILFVNNHKNRNQPWTAVFIFKNLPKPTENMKTETATALLHIILHFDSVITNPVNSYEYCQQNYQNFVRMVQ